MKKHAPHPDRHFEQTAEFRFYGELNDFLPLSQREQALTYRFNGKPGVKDPIEVFGVPHTEVDLLVANGKSVGFDYQLKNADRIEAYPVSASVSISPRVKLREATPGNIAFVADVNLGKLARLLRLLGFDTLFAGSLSDRVIVDISVEQQRIILTRDRRLLYAKAAVHGYWVRAILPDQQLAEVVRRFDLAARVRPFYRCTLCNGLIDTIEKQRVLHLLQPKTQKYYETFYRCRNCGKVYWQGTHIERIKERLAGYLND